MYRCTNCGSEHGVPNGYGHEDWYWRQWRHGSLGPFCSEGCAQALHIDNEPRFTLEEWERLHFLNFRLQHPEVVLDGNMEALNNAS